MLSYLEIEDLAVIEHLRLPFGSGLTVITGETGSGKSLLFDALGLLLGERGSGDLVRSGARRARIAALFQTATPSWSLAEEEVALEREILKEGRSLFRINGQIVTAAQVRALAPQLVGLGQQGEASRLLASDVGRRLLDEWAGLGPLVGETARLHREHRHLREEREALGGDDQQARREAERLAYELEELEAAGPDPGEWLALLEEEGRLAHLERIQQAENGLWERIVEGSGSEAGALDLLAQAEAPIAALGLPELSDLVDRLSAVREELLDVCREMRRRTASWELSRERQAEVEERMSRYRQMLRRFGPEIGDVMAYWQNLREEIKGLEGRRERRQALAIREAEAEGAFREAAGTLSAARRQAAERFALAVTAILPEVGLPLARVTVTLVETAPSATGIDGVQLLFQPNPGEPPQPLSRIASGGELSRLSLALRTLAVRAEGAPTLLFDEVDAAVGGAVAWRIGQRLRALSGAHQVIAISHQPPVAALGHGQVEIRKLVREGRTYSEARVLEGEERVRELGRMLGGDAAKAEALAREMLLTGMAGS